MVGQSAALSPACLCYAFIKLRSKAKERERFYSPQRLVCRLFFQRCSVEYQLPATRNPGRCRLEQRRLHESPRSLLASMRRCGRDPSSVPRSVSVRYGLPRDGDGAWGLGRGCRGGQRAVEGQGTPGNEAKPPCLCSSRAGRSQNPEVLAEEQMCCFKKMILSGSLRCSESSTIPSSGGGWRVQTGSCHQAEALREPQSPISRRGTIEALAVSELFC